MKNLLLLIAITSIFSCNQDNELEQMFLNSYNEKNFNGSVLIAENGKIIFHMTYGNSDTLSQNLLTENHAFNTASISKLFTATAISILLDDNLLSLEDNIVNILPKFQYKEIKIKHLLNHTSGLPDYTNSPQFFVPLYRKGVTIANNNDVLEWLYSAPELFFTPGEKFDYCNAEYVVLAEIVEKISSQTYKTFIEKNIFEPLDMQDSYVIINPENINSDSIALGIDYSLNGKNFISNQTSHRGLYDGIYGDGGIYSTAKDLYKFLLGFNKLVSKELVDKALSVPILANSEKGRYGLGWEITFNEKNQKIIGHRGRWGGYSTKMVMNLENKRVIIILSNNTMSPYSMEDYTSVINNILDGKEWVMPRKQASRVLSFCITTKGIDTAKELFAELVKNRDKYIFYQTDFYLLGVSLYDKGYIEESIFILELTAQEFPDYKYTFQTLGEIYEEKGNLEKAIKNLQSWVELTPDDNETKEKIVLMEKRRQSESNLK
ncbi:MAG: hypothetical protein EHM93_02020 [Bacteroidales bacterium]|nr:MAG: hypothetical protein EHM93_02020 [Bacteroidales bacterium]